MPNVYTHYVHISAVGEFGIVYKAHLLPDLQVPRRSLTCPMPQTVAVKTLKGKHQCRSSCHIRLVVSASSSSMKRCFLILPSGYFGREEIRNMMDESVKMKRFDHPNVISLIGVCVDAGPAPYIVMPFMANGSLLSYLKKNRSELMLSVSADEDIVCFIDSYML